MINPEKPRFKEQESPGEEGGTEKIYERGKISFFPEGAKNPFQIEVARRIIDALSPYLDTKVHVRYKAMKPENPGFNSRLNPELRDENYHDSITINPDYQSQEELPFYLLHELGHSLEEKLEQLIKDKNIEALPVGLDEEYADFYADLIACYILKPESLKRLEDIPKAKNTILAIQEMFNNDDFSELRTRLNELTNQLQKADKDAKTDDSETTEEKRGKLFGRVFEKIDEYIKR